MAKLAGVDVIAFESRRAAEFERLLARHDATYISAPALREIPLDENPEALRLVDDLEANQIDAIILLTGVGTRALVQAAETRCPQPKLVELLARVPLIARGPKPVAALRELGLKPEIQAPEPNTWREILAEVDRKFPVGGLRIAIQEYGRPNARLAEGLEKRGAIVIPIPVYRWALPEDLGPLREAIEKILGGNTPIVVFTTAVQLDHLLDVASDSAPAVVGALRDHCVIASIGPSATEALHERGLAPEIEPAHPKLGYLAAAIAEDGARLVGHKKRGRSP